MSACTKFRSGPNADKFLKCLANVLTVLIETYSPQFSRSKGLRQNDPYKTSGCAAIIEPWSNGKTSKLNLVKRQMHGCTKIDLLQARLIGAE